MRMARNVAASRRARAVALLWRYLSMALWGKISQSRSHRSHSPQGLRAFRTDAALLPLCSDDKTPKLWNVAIGKLMSQR